MPGFLIWVIYSMTTFGEKVVEGIKEGGCGRTNPQLVENLENTHYHTCCSTCPYFDVQNIMLGHLNKSMHGCIKTGILV